MTSLVPDQATGPVFTSTMPITVIPTPVAARHRSEHVPPSVVPAWAQLAASVVAVAAAWFAVVTRDAGGGALIVVAVGILAAAFTPDAVARYDAQLAERAIADDDDFDGEAAA